MSKKEEKRAKRNMRNAAIETLAIGFVGDGIVAATIPRRHVMLREFGPQWMRRATRWTAQHPWLVRAVAVAETAGAGFLIYRLTRRSAKAAQQL